MPPKAKFTRNDILEAALQIVRENGLEAVTSRELGKKLGCSACPVFTIFQNMQEVYDEVNNAAKSLYKEYVNEGLKEDKAFRGVGSAYIKFAMKEPRLFQLLFMKEKSEPKDIENTLKTIDDNYEVILKSVQEPYALDLGDAQNLYHHLWIYTHGIATMCATKVCTFQQEEIETMLTEIFISLLVKMKGSKKDDSN